ncbi:microfibrillar-associated protein 5 isoform X3 [Pleurodeles waltl]|uniref:microfibrillar-associated protein 5 isoform X3 n=1 Tax=Pleurodeles waltl TaxID=8319 RepID=UPI0037095612
MYPPLLLGMMLALRPALLLCILVASLPAWHIMEVNAQQQGQLGITLADTTKEPPAPNVSLPSDEAVPDGSSALDASVPDGDSPPDAPDCREVQYPCTRIYSVLRPVKQCLGQVCVSSNRRVYMLNNEICSRTMCKEDEVMQEERCRQKMGLPPRRTTRSHRPFQWLHYGIRELGVL